MFTGIVSGIGAVIAVTERNDVRRIAIACDYKIDTIDIGASILCSGICMTVVTKDDAAGKTVVGVEAGPQTLVATNVRDWEVGRRINLERALKIGDEPGGHLVSRHVDGLPHLVGPRAFW